MIIEAKKQTFHQSISTLPISRFDRISRSMPNIDSVLHLLLIEGCKANKEVLINAWTIIIKEYISSTSERDSNKEDNLIKSKMLAAKIDYENVNRLLNTLPYYIDDNAILMLYDYNIKIDPNKELEPQIIRAKKKSLSYVTKFNDYKFQLSEKEESVKKSNKFKTLQEITYQIEKFYGHGMKIDLDTTTTEKWLVIEENYIKDIERLKSKKNESVH